MTRVRRYVTDERPRLVKRRRDRSNDPPRTIEQRADGSFQEVTEAPQVTEEPERRRRRRRPQEEPQQAEQEPEGIDPLSLVQQALSSPSKIDLSVKQMPWWGKAGVVAAIAYAGWRFFSSEDD